MVSSVSEAISKLQPDRMLYLRGFDDFGAAAALHSASPAGFTVSGVFRDPADFAVLVVYDADCFHEHPRLKYLPDFSLAGIVLSFDVTYTNLQPLDSPKFPTIDWPYLDVIRPDGSTGQVALFANAVQDGGTYTPASGVFTLAGTAGAGDTVTLWFQNIAYPFTAAGGETAAAVATALAVLINAGVTGGIYSLTAVALGAVLTVTASPAGYDGNMITMYAVTSGGVTTNATAPFTGGVSGATWKVTLDFTALGIDSVRQAWLTFAPQYANSAAYVAAEWDAVFSNWSVSGGSPALQVAGPNSVRVEESDVWCTYSGKSWARAGGFYSQGWANVASKVGDSVTVTYWCSATHDLYLGTALFPGRGTVSVSLDGAAAVAIATALDTTSEIPARRIVRAGVAAGQHSVKIALTAGGLFYFDFLEAAVLSDVPDAIETMTDTAPAIDYDTQHGYQLSPQRLMNIFDKLGFSGPIDEYVGVFWWNQRMSVGATIAQAAVTFGGAWNVGDSIFIDIGGETIGKSVFAGENATIFAAHFAYFINELYSGVWASAAGPVLTITGRSPGGAYQFSLSASVITTASGTAAVVGALDTGVVGGWDIDPSQPQVVNYAARQWHADLYAEIAARGMQVTSAFSMELVNPPGAWAAQYADGTLVTTATGFGVLNSTQCAPGQPDFLAYQQSAYLELAQLQAAAGLDPSLQFGEFLWWFFAGGSLGNQGMAYYDAATRAAALMALGRPLAAFHTTNDDPSVNGYADANFLRGRLRDHAQGIRAAVQAAQACDFEVLYPYDVNYPKLYGPFALGGRLNHYVNTPPEWMSHAAGYLEGIKIEALDFGSGTRSLDLAAQAIALAPGWGWPLRLCRYLYPVFNGGCPWQYEQQLARAALIPALTPFAMDHVCLFAWDVGAELAPAAWSM
jgi:hypothetical protein